MKFRARRRGYVIIMVAALLLAVFAVDVRTPLGVADWVLYTVPIFLAAYWGRRRDIYITTAAATGLLVLGYLLSPASVIAPWNAILNRLLEAFALWFAAYMLTQRARLEDGLQLQEAQLQDQVQARTAALQAEVAERTRAEQALRVSERRYRDLYDNSPDMYMVGAPAEHIIRDCNETLARTLGYTRDELIGQSSATIFDPASMAYVMANLPAELGRRRRASFEVQLRHCDGSLLEVLMETTIEPDPNGGPPFSRVVFHDITERKRMENELRTRELALRVLNQELEQRVAEQTEGLRNAVGELERANAGKDAFMAAVSHELRTPLTGILGMAEGLQREMWGPLTERQRRYVTAIQVSGDRLLSMVDAVLNYTHAMGDHQPITPELCRLTELCAVSIRAARTLADKKKQSVRLEIEPADVQIRSDSTSILQILNALLDNAVKFTEPGGSLGIHVKPGDDEQTVKVIVWDTGIGITPEQMPYLFKPLTQVDQRLARRFEGLGLGLALVKRKVEILGGAVTVESQAGVGSRFIITLPVARFPLAT